MQHKKMRMSGNNGMRLCESVGKDVAVMGWSCMVYEWHLDFDLVWPRGDGEEVGGEGLADAEKTGSTTTQAQAEQRGVGYSTGGGDPRCRYLSTFCKKLRRRVLEYSRAGVFCCRFTFFMNSMHVWGPVSQGGARQCRVSL